MDIVDLAKVIAAELRMPRSGHMIMSGFFRCLCGKIHARGGIGPNTTCTCGTNLYKKAWN
jgi:hypothetical protein